MSKTKTPAPRAAKPAASKAPSAIQQAGAAMASLSVKTIKPVVQKPVKKVDPIAKPAPAPVKVDATRQYTTRMAKADRSNQILSAALKVAGKVGYIKMTRADVAQQAGVSECLITRYFATMDALRDAVVQEVAKESMINLPTPANLRILAEALVAKHKDAGKAAKKHKDAIVALLFK